MQQKILQFRLKFHDQALEERFRIVVSDHDRSVGGFAVEWLTTDATGGERWIDPASVKRRPSEKYIQWALGATLFHLMGTPQERAAFGGGTLNVNIDEHAVVREWFEPLWMPIE